MNLKHPSPWLEKQEITKTLKLGHGGRSLFSKNGLWEVPMTITSSFFNIFKFDFKKNVPNNLLSIFSSRSKT
jgi:hypothetical protein